MFNWTTTTLINELPHFGVEMNGKALRIGKHLFEKRWVESIRKAEGKPMEICEAELDMALVKEALDAKNASVARLYIYVGLDGSEESIYANDWYRKGMPLSVSFTNNNAATMVENIVNTVKDFNVFTKVKKVLEVSPKEKGSSILKIKGTHEHQRLQKIQVLIDAGMGEEIAVVNYELNHKEDAAVSNVNPGVNGFGTYSQLLKDLRLPTANHNHWLSVQKDEMPIVGALYTQYIINYYAPSTANPSFTAIGNRSMSETTHVFWVKNDLVGAWEEKLAMIDPDGDATLNTTVGKVAKTYSNKKTSLVERVDTLEKE
jgi:hypothetical protein